MSDTEDELLVWDGDTLGFAPGLVWDDETIKYAFPPNSEEGFKLVYNGPLVATIFPGGGVVFEIRRDRRCVVEGSFDEPPYNVSGHLK